MFVNVSLLKLLHSCTPVSLGLLFTNGLDFIDASREIPLLSTALSLSTTASDITEDDLAPYDPIYATFKSPVRTHIFVYRDGFCGRGNTIVGYHELNRHVSYSEWMKG